MVCRVNHGENCYIPYIDCNDDSILSHNASMVNLCGGCWDRMCRLVPFPVNINSEQFGPPVNEDYLVWLKLEFPLDEPPKQYSIRRHQRITRPHVCEHCHQPAHRIRDIPWEITGTAHFSVFQTNLCEDCWEALIMVPGSMPFVGPTVEDALGCLEIINAYYDGRDFFQEQEDIVLERTGGGCVAV